MKQLNKFAGACFSAALLAACSGGGSGTPLSPLSAGFTAERARVRPSYSVLYSFKGRKGDGASPLAGLINVKGTLYGTTWSGGSGSCSSSRVSGCGTVFSITTSGKETVLHSFKGGKTDGALPVAGLINVNGTLYGTTTSGGSGPCRSGFFPGCGTVFSITTSGKETVLHSFKGGDASPAAGLLSVNGTLYGTTEEDGYGFGTVFSITTSGKETVLHSFTYYDGHFPEAGLINVNGTLYGTTYEGGTKGFGTVFSITTSGTETVLYSFKGAGDGGLPVAGLTNVKGTLYGTTDCCGGGYGTVNKITTSGREGVLYSFAGKPDGALPAAGLLNVNGTLYGTTQSGGSGLCSSGRLYGCGTVFSITTSGTEAKLHSFKGGSGDGEYPYAGLINVKGALYGTTSGGGANGYGTVFSLTP